MRGKISPSLMCVDLLKLKECLEVFEKNEIEYLHIDIMDGTFVPNFTLGTDYVKNIRRLTNIPLDIHMMIECPENKLEWFDIRENDYVSVHYESTPHIQRAIAKIKEKKAKPMLALNPGTPLSALDYLVEDIYGILLMTVNPGFAGQKLIAQTLEKISDTKNYLRKIGREDIEIEVDGNVSFENAKKMRKAGADIFVAGTSSIFTEKMELSSAISKLRGIIA